MISVYKKFTLMIILTIFVYLFLYNFTSYAENTKSVLDEIVKEIEEEKIKKDRFYKCWLDNVKPNSTESHTNVVAIYCSNKTGYNPLK